MDTVPAPPGLSAAGLRAAPTTPARSPYSSRLRPRLLCGPSSPVPEEQGLSARALWARQPRTGSGQEGAGAQQRGPVSWRGGCGHRRPRRRRFVLRPGRGPRAKRAAVRRPEAPKDARPDLAGDSNGRCFPLKRAGAGPAPLASSLGCAIGSPAESPARRLRGPGGAAAPLLFGGSPSKRGSAPRGWRRGPCRLQGPLRDPTAGPLGPGRRPGSCAHPVVQAAPRAVGAREVAAPGPGACRPLRSCLLLRVLRGPGGRPDRRPRNARLCLEGEGGGRGAGHARGVLAGRPLPRRRRGAGSVPPCGGGGGGASSGPGLDLGEGLVPARPFLGPAGVQTAGQTPAAKGTRKGGNAPRPAGSARRAPAERRVPPGSAEPRGCGRAARTRAPSARQPPPRGAGSQCRRRPVRSATPRSPDGLRTRLEAAPPRPPRGARGRLNGPGLPCRSSLSLRPRPTFRAAGARLLRLRDRERPGRGGDGLGFGGVEGQEQSPGGQEAAASAPGREPRRPAQRLLPQTARPGCRHAGLESRGRPTTGGRGPGPRRPSGQPGRRARARRRRARGLPARAAWRAVIGTPFTPSARGPRAALQAAEAPRGPAEAEASRRRRRLCLPRTRGSSGDATGFLNPGPAQGAPLFPRGRPEPLPSPSAAVQVPAPAGGEGSETRCSGAPRATGTRTNSPPPPGLQDAARKRAQRVSRSPGPQGTRRPPPGRCSLMREDWRPPLGDRGRRERGLGVRRPREAAPRAPGLVPSQLLPAPSSGPTRPRHGQKRGEARRAWREQKGARPALAGNRTRVSRVGGENSATEPPMPADGALGRALGRNPGLTPRRVQGVHQGAAELSPALRRDRGGDLSSLWR
ncbi:collagen alpha-1(I) chain-like [Talpa occidentalis]|uniref:collagen alpha-1(I) chain-like n=1 Tax=Talpa occidentalis TaxID=50954 RepID=UPI0023F63668|nr:collagen alpha-1(I) chain-like [Talpa occidentalis]